MEPSQTGQAKDDLTRERGAGGEKRSADRAAGVAHRFDTEERPSSWNIDHEMAEWFRGREIELQAAPRPGNRRAPVPTVETIVDNDIIDFARDSEVPRRWHRDVLGGQGFRIRQPDTP